MSDLAKSELAIKRDEWLDSKEGRKCTDTTTLTSGPYLRNRIELAFLAGAKADAEVQEEICNELARQAGFGSTG